MINRMSKVISDMEERFRAIRWEDDAQYAAWISQAYYIAKKSTSFLGLTMIHSANHPEYLKRCTAHIGEETGHEKLIVNDLKNLGRPLMPELPSTSAVYQTQYYRIVSEHPMSFVGYVLFLELLAPAYGPYIMDRVSNKRALSFMKVHSSADEDHVVEALKILEIIPKEVKEMVMTNFLMTAESYSTMLENLSQYHQSLREAA
jgi:hypothetical protein